MSDQCCITMICTLRNRATAPHNLELDKLDMSVVVTNTLCQKYSHVNMFL